MKSQSPNRTAIDKFPSSFFVLVFVLSIPFWFIGTWTGIQLLPGLPVSALGAFCPAVAACLLVYRENRMAGVTELLGRSLDFRRIRSKAWYVPIVLLMPGVTALTYGLMRWMGLPLETPQFSLLEVVGLFLAFFAGALGEELGWSGYAINPMQARWTAVHASLLLGSIWAAWHLVPLVQAHRSPGWIAWWTVGTLATRVIMVWLYNNTGQSVFATALYHAMSNLSWQLFPAYYDPRITGLLLVLAAAVVTVVWGPQALARHRYGRLNDDRLVSNGS